MGTLLNKFENINQEKEEEQIKIKANGLGFGYVDFEEIKIQMDSLAIIPENIARKIGIVCFFSIKKKVRIAILDENNLDTKDFLQKLKDDGYSININLTSNKSIKIAFSRYEFIRTKSVVNENITINNSEKNENENEEKSKDNKSDEEESEEKKFQFQNLLKSIYIGAIKNKASDMHFEFFEKKMIIRLRVDGGLRIFKEITKKEGVEMCRLIKYKAKLILNKNDITQDGEYQIEVNERKITLRVSVLPAKHGENIVLRILDPINAKVDLKNLGFLDFQKKIIEEESEKKQGLIIVTGPTGSGKTSTLYSLLNKINTVDKKIITLEDPVEYELEGITQTDVSEILTFSDGLKASLRQDPDVIMLGEIRDFESASIALQASNTGHSVLSTIHTNSALKTIFRLKNLGIQEYLIATSINLIIGQRLIKKNCENCSEKKEISEKTLIILKGINPNIGVDFEKEKLFENKGEGCEECKGSGFKGREVIGEVLQFDDEIRKMITNEEKLEEISIYLKKRNFVKMQDVAIAKALKGITTFEEAFKII